MYASMKRNAMAFLVSGAVALSAVAATQNTDAGSATRTQPVVHQAVSKQQRSQIPAEHYNQAPRQQYHPVYQQQGSHTHVGYEEDSFYDSFIKGKLHLGASYTTSAAKTTTAPAGEYYLGNLNNLKEEDMAGIGVNIQYDLCDYIGLSFATDTHVELAAWNQINESTDGSIVMDGMLYQIIVQYPFRFTDYGFTLTPYVGLGIMDLSTEWSYANWWHYGWSTPDDYKHYGNGAKKPHNGYSRWMVLEEPSNPFTFTLGLAFRLLEHLDIDVFYRQVSVDDIQATFHTGKANGPVMREGSFPAEFSTFGAALRYVF